MQSPLVPSSKRSDSARQLHGMPACLDQTPSKSSSKRPWIILTNESYPWHATLMAIRWQVLLWERQLELVPLQGGCEKVPSS